MAQFDQTMSNKELKSCPFCGGKAKLKEYVDPYDPCIWSTEVYCENCKAIMYSDEDEAIKAWNKRVDVVKTDECCEKSCKDENATLPLVPKWKVWGYNKCILRIPVSQQDALQFIVRSFKDNKYMCEVGISVNDTEEIGTFNTLKEAKQKVNECIKELGERLMYFSNNIKTEE